MTYDPRNYDTFIGLDVDIKSFVVTVRDHASMNRLLKIPANPEAFGNYVEKMYNKERGYYAYMKPGLQATDYAIICYHVRLNVCWYHR